MIKVRMSINFHSYFQENDFLNIDKQEVENNIIIYTGSLYLYYK